MTSTVIKAAWIGFWGAVAAAAVSNGGQLLSAIIGGGGQPTHNVNSGARDCAYAVGLVARALEHGPDTDRDEAVRVFEASYSECKGVGRRSEFESVCQNLRDLIPHAKDDNQKDRIQAFMLSIRC